MKVIINNKKENNRLHNLTKKANNLGNLNEK